MGSLDFGPSVAKDAPGDRIAGLQLALKAVIKAPADHLLQQGREGAALLREAVLGAQGVLAVDDTLDESMLLQPLEAVREEFGRKARARLQELLEARPAEEKVADDEQRPAVSYDVEGPGDRTGLVVGLVHCVKI